MLTTSDRNLLKSLYIRQDDDIAVAPEPRVDEPSHPRTSLDVTAMEQEYIEALKDPHSPRDNEGHPKIAGSLYGRAQANLRAVAIWLRGEAYTRSERCKCGALHPSAGCYL